MLVLAVVVILLVGRRVLVVVLVLRVHVTPLILRQPAVLVRVRPLDRHLRRVLPACSDVVRVAAGPVRQLLRREVPVRVRVGAPELVLPAHLHVEPRILERGVPLPP